MEKITIIVSTTLFSLYCCLCTGLSIAAENPSSLPQPKLQFEETAYYFGIAGLQETVTHVFKFQNTGDAELTIIEISSPCGCVAELLSAKTIQPGATGTIKISLDTGNRSGKKSERVVVKTNDPNYPEIALTVTGTVKTSLGVIPEFVYFGNVNQGNIISEEIKLLQLSEEKLNLERIDTSAQFLSAKFTERPRLGNKDRQEYLIRLTLNTNNTSTGGFAEVITLHTNSNEHPAIDVPITGNIVAQNAETFAVPDFNGTLVFTANLDQNWDIFLWESDQEEPKRLTQTLYDEKFPALSLQKDKLIYTTTAGHPVLLDLPSGEETVLEIQGFPDKWDYCSFAPDGQRLVCSYFEPTEVDKAVLVVVDLDTLEARRMLSQFGPQFFPAWAPKGSRIAYAYAHCSSECGKIIQELWLADLNRQEAHQIALTNAHGLTPSWAPDGWSIVFSADIVDNFDIWSFDLKHKRLRQLTEYSGLDESPAFSPDGQQIVFVSNRSGQRGLWLKDLNTGGLLQLEPFGEQPIEIKDVTWK